jgi:hypothetical protein
VRQRDGSVVAAKDKAAGGASPLNLGSFAGQDWSKDLEVDAGVTEERASRPIDTYEAGNLAALEDESSPPGPRRTTPAAAVSRGVEAPVSAPPAKGGGSGAIIAVVLLVVAVAGAAGAYFGGLIH